MAHVYADRVTNFSILGIFRPVSELDALNQAPHHYALLVENSQGNVIFHVHVHRT